MLYWMSSLLLAGSAVRLRRGWRGRRAAWIAVVGFLLALFTFAGVNYLVQGLHSYK